MEEGSSVQFGDGLLHKENGFTIKIVPDVSDTIHTIHLSAKMAKIGIISFVVVLLISCVTLSYSLYTTFFVKSDDAELEKMRQISNMQQEQLLQLSKKADGLQQELDELTQMEERHNKWISLINAWATLAPGFGMLGTVIGLIGMLLNIEDKSSLGPNMAVALVTTFYGSMMANWLLIPMASKLAYQNNLEVRSKEMIIEGILGIQSGDHPRILAQRLLTYLDPKDRKVLESELIKD